MNQEAHTEKESHIPGLSLFLYLLAGLAVLVGLVGCVWTLSSFPKNGTTLFIAYAFAVSGIVEFAIFSAFGLGLTYLKKISLAKN